MRAAYLSGALFAASVCPMFAGSITVGVVLNASSPAFNRTLGGNPPPGLSGVGTAVFYSSIPFTVDLSDTFTMATGNSLLSPGAADDTFLDLYSGSFNPASPMTNVLEADDDSGPGLLSLITRGLNPGVDYILVATTFSNAVTGTFDVTISGIDGTPTLGGEAIPEPASLAFVAAGLAAMWALRRKRA